MNHHLDSIDAGIMEKRVQQRDRYDGPRIGDFIRFPTGELEVFSHDHGHVLQTSPTGSIYLSESGRGSFSGMLNPGTPRNEMTLSNETYLGEFWFFHHNIAGAGRAVRFKTACRVFTTTAKYSG